MKARMKVVIWAGGFGTRISEESHMRPKPMIEIGGQPILWHIMKTYSYYGYNEFVILAGYLQQIIKEYFANYYLHCSNVTFDFSRNGAIEVHNNIAEPWKVTIIDTGFDVMTGGRLKRAQPYIGDETFLLTYGDGVANIDINETVDFHKKNGKIATITAINPGQRFGVLEIDDCGIVKSFQEKPEYNSGTINGGFMVMQPEVFNYIEGDDTFFEREPLQLLAKEKQLMAFHHHGFWQCMDTQRDKEKLEHLWEAGNAPWKVWA